MGVGASVALAGPHDVVVATAIDVQDATFEANVTSALSGAGVLNDMERLPNGKLLIATDTGLKRLNADGTLDQTFVPDSDIATRWVTNVAVLPDGSFVATNGFLSPNPSKFDSSGVRDNNSNGWNSYSGTPRSLFALPDGGFLVAGETCVQKIDANGVEVASFLTNHFSTLMGNSACPEVFDIVADGSGFVLATNLVGALTHPVIRLNGDGTLDTTFNNNVSSWLSDPNKTWTAHDVVRMPDGDFVVVGEFDSGPGAREVNLARINADGTSDTSFNSTVEQQGGSSLWNNSSPVWEGSARSVAVDPLGEILVGGMLYVLDDPSVRDPNDQNWNQLRTRVVRLSTGGSYISAFEAGVSWPDNFSNTAIELVPIPSEGKTIVFSSFSNGGHVRTYSGNFAVAPTVTTVSPTSGSTGGGTSITITGTNFVNGSTVTVGGAACTNVTVVSATSITCTTPSGSAGTASVVVSSSGLSNSANTLFTYDAPSSTPVFVPAPVTQPPASQPPATQPPSTPGVPALVNSDNQQTLTQAPGGATAIVNGEVVAVEVEAPADLPAAQKDPEDRSPAEVAALQDAAESLIDELNDVAGGDSGLSVVPSPTGASITGLMNVPVPIENTVIVKTDDQSTVFAALNQDGSVTEVQPGAQIEVLGNGQVGVAAFGLTPGETVEFVLMSTPTLLGRFDVNAQGGIKAQASLPDSIGTGSHTLVVASPSVKASLGLKVGSAVRPTLPVTGGDTDGLAPVMLLLAVGAVLVTVSRRRITLVP